MSAIRDDRDDEPEHEHAEDGDGDEELLHERVARARARRRARALRLHREARRLAVHELDPLDRLEVAHERLGRLVARGRFLGEELLDDEDGPGADPRSLVRERRRRRGADELHRLHGRLVLPRDLAREHLVERDPEGEEVGASVDHGALAVRMLGREILRRPDEEPLLRDGRVVVLAADEPEADELHLAARVHEDVLGLDVPVEELVRREVAERARDLARDLERLGLGELLALDDQLAERAAFETHGEVGVPELLARVEHRRDVGVSKPEERARLAQEAFSGDGRARDERLREDLERDALALGRVGEHDRALRVAELLEELVAREGRRDRRRLIRHELLRSRSRRGRRRGRGNGRGVRGSRHARRRSERGRRAAALELLELIGLRVHDALSRRARGVRRDLHGRAAGCTRPSDRRSDRAR